MRSFDTDQAPDTADLAADQTAHRRAETARDTAYWADPARATAPVADDPWGSKAAAARLTAANRLR